MTEWFEEWFGEEYLHLYPHRDEADADRVVGLIAAAVELEPGWRVLDIACGAGRHAAALEARGARPVGLDLSPSLLRVARARVNVPLVRGDLRDLPFRAGCADLTVNLFTSFGYFEHDDEHAAALGGMLATVRPGGWFAIDYLHAPTVVRRLVPEETMMVGGREVMVTRRLSPDARFVYKTIGTPEGRRFVERVRLFTPAELEAMVVVNGFEVTHRFGDYHGGPLDDAAARTILVARRS